MQTQKRPVYTKVQLGKYFDRLKLPIKHRKYDVSNESAENALEYLSLLQKHHLVAIPFENLSLHYSSHRKSRSIQMNSTRRLSRAMAEADTAWRTLAFSGYYFDRLASSSIRQEHE
jgi:arylamine N-acetyltransferase